MTIKKSITISIITLLLIFCVSKTAYAGTLGLTLSPSLFEANIKPGKTITQVFTLQNKSTAQQAFVARIIPFTPGDELGNPTLKPNLRPEWLKYFSLSNIDIRLDETFSLEANQSTQLVLTINIPNRSGSDDLYATLLVSTLVQENQKANSTLGVTMGSNLLITVSPLNHPPSLIRIADFSPIKSSYLFRYADSYLVDSLAPIYFTATAKNLGKYFVKSTGILKVDKNGTNISTQPLLANNILSNSQRVLEGSPSGELVYKPALTSLGNYLVSLDLRSDNSSSHAEFVIFVFPFKITAALLIGLLILKIILKFSKNSPNGPQK